MRFLFFTAGPALALAALASCGGTVATTGSGGHTSGTSSSSGSTVTTSSSSGSTTASSSGSSWTIPHGDCQTDADCSGGTCTPITPGGYQVCVSTVTEAMGCQGGGFAQCCTSADCGTSGKCYPTSELQFCGGAAPPENGCAADACKADSDCDKGQICTPAGAFGLAARACLAAFCKTDADCTAKPGGACILVGSNPCCSHEAPSGLGCAYPGGCTTDADCPGGACTLGIPSGVSVCGAPHGPCPP